MKINEITSNQVNAIVSEELRHHNLNGQSLPNA